MLQKEPHGKEKGNALVFVLTAFLMLLSQLLYWYNPEIGLPVFMNFCLPLALLAAGAMIRDRIFLKNSEIQLAAAFFIWYAITRMLNGDPYLSKEKYNLAFLFTVLCAVFPAAVSLREKSGPRLETAVGALLAVFFTALAGISLYTVITGQQLRLPGALLTVRLDADARLEIWGKHPNIVGSLFTACSIAVIYHLVSQKKMRALIAPAVFVYFSCYCAVCMTASRTAMLNLALFTGIAAAILIVSRFVSLRARLRALLFILLAAGFTVVLYLGYHAVRQGIDFLSVRFRQSSFQSGADTSLEGTEEGALLSADGQSSSLEASSCAPDTREGVIAQRMLTDHWYTFNGRTEIYRATFIALSKHMKTLFIGNRDDAFMEWVNLNMSYSCPHTHNSFLQVLMTCGIVGLFLMVWFLIKLLRSIYHLLFDPGRPSADRILALIPLPILLHSMLEPFIFTYYAPINLLFFLYAGFVTNRAARSSQRAIVLPANIKAPE